MPCTYNFCYNIGDEMRRIRDNYERGCLNNECTDMLMPEERKVLTEYVSDQFLDRRVMELARCLVQNVLRTKRDKSIKQFSMVPRHYLTGRVNSQRNILTDITACEKMGLNAITSSARFMGSIATVLKCNTSMFNMDSIKKLINDSNWRFNTNFNSIQQDAISELLEIFHNYIIGITCGNPVRTWTPNVMYTYGLYASQCPKTLRRDFCTVLEKIPYAPRQETVKDFIRQGKMTPELFLSVFAQISLTLEMMQQRYGFVHFDLHSDNIMMRPVYDQTGNGIKWSYMVYGYEYVMKDIQFIATLIDYGFSCFSPSIKESGELSLNNKFVGMGMFQKYGIMDFMIPGYDIFKLLSNMRMVLLTTLDPSSTKNFIMDPYGQENNIALLNLIDYIFRDIYQAPDIFTSRTNTSTENYRVYNVLLCKGAGLCPLDVLDKISSSGVINTILHLQKVPWTIVPRSSYLPFVCKQKIPDFLADIMPNWKTIINDDTFNQPTRLLQESEIANVVYTMLDIIKNKKMLYDFDYRPLMIVGGVISEEALAFYERLLFTKDGLYYGYFQNTMMFYNLLTSFLDTYYYYYHKNDKAFISRFVQLTDRITILLRFIQEPGFVSRISSMVRFGQTIVNMRKSQQKKFCCIATKQTLGDMAMKQSQMVPKRNPLPPSDAQCGCEAPKYTKKYQLNQQIYQGASRQQGQKSKQQQQQQQQGQRRSCQSGQRVMKGTGPQQQQVNTYVLLKPVSRGVQQKKTSPPATQAVAYAPPAAFLTPASGGQTALTPFYNQPTPQQLAAQQALKVQQARRRQQQTRKLQQQKAAVQAAAAAAVVPSLTIQTSQTILPPTSAQQQARKRQQQARKLQQQRIAAQAAAAGAVPPVNMF